METGTIVRATVESPLGTLRVLVARGVLRALLFPEEDEATVCRRLGLPFPVSREEADPAGIPSRLRAYFAGELHALDEIAVEPGGSPFSRAVRLALRRIPPGETRSYGALAVAIGRPRAVRAVGRANATNPVPIVLPCHRVIASDGRLGGYGGRPERKAWLLRHEGAHVRV